MTAYGPDYLRCVHFRGIQKSSAVLVIDPHTVRDASGPGIAKWPCLRLPGKKAAATTCAHLRVMTAAELKAADGRPPGGGRRLRGGCRGREVRRLRGAGDRADPDHRPLRLCRSLRPSPRADRRRIGGAMNEIRLYELRQCASFVREARVALRDHDLPKAVRYAKLATRGLYFMRGLAAGRGTGARTGSAGLTKVVDNLWDAIGEALRPAPEADLEELIAEVARGVDVLRTRDGVVMEEAQAVERGRNIVASLEWRYRITRL